MFENLLTNQTGKVLEICFKKGKSIRFDDKLYILVMMMTTDQH
jgi:biotin carboxyl carrier protein